MISRRALFHAALLGLSRAEQVLAAASTSPRLLTVRPSSFEGALRNPLMGFRRSYGSLAWMASHEWATLIIHTIKWNELEARESDGIDRIRAFCDEKWAGMDAANLKVIPRVFLRWSREDETYWPEDLETGDYSSPRFTARMLRLVERLGQAWDNDSRVAFVQMGLIGRWGEQHTPEIGPAMQKIMGDAFMRAFAHKKVLIRYPWHFRDYAFGVYWDSWAHAEESVTHLPAFQKLGPRWKSQPYGGETAYDWGLFREHPGESPNATLSQAGHRQYLIDSIRGLHCNHLGWVSDYDAKIPQVRAGAEMVQRAFGYRFEIVSASFPTRLVAGQKFPFEIQVRNAGSTPLYADWPLRLSLLDEATRREAWRADIAAPTSSWMPGDKWDAPAQEYAVAPTINTLRAQVALENVPRGKYLLAISVLDSAGSSPALQLATSQYWRGGLHLLARVGVGVDVGDASLRGVQMDNPNADRTLRYLARA